MGEAFAVDFIQQDVAQASESVETSMHLLRLLNELQDDLSRHSTTAYNSAVQGQWSSERISALLAVAAAVSEARVRVADASYNELDVCVNALDRRLKLMEAVLKMHGQGMVEEGAMGVEEKMVDFIRPADAIAGRVRRRESSSGAGGGGGGASLSGASMLGGGSIKQQLAAAAGAASASVHCSPGALDVAIGSFEPLYCAYASPLPGIPEMAHF